ncbi:MAG: metal-dependent hydrolase [Ruminococcaceae bacterium]|nr:metal-dependent hydrolase [Oscillospiraceae bacterium]
MTIDFHTHIFPDKIAPATIAHLEKIGGIPAHTNGTAQDLLRSMDEAGIDRSVVLPVVTKPSQFDSINRFAAQINQEHDRLISFGGIHPDNDDIEAKLDFIVASGLKGIKLHPDYQGVFIDDERNVRILREALRRNLYVVIHAGIDIGLPDPVHCTPARTAAVLNELKTDPDDPRIVLAHVGGWRMWDDVETYLVGKAVYLDLAFSLGQIDNEQLLRIIRRHGAERILFASDSPWGNQQADRQCFESLPLTQDERDFIAWKNAKMMLGD